MDKNAPDLVRCQIWLYLMIIIYTHIGSGRRHDYVLLVVCNREPKLMPALKTRLLDPVVITAAPGFEVVRLQLRPGVSLVSAQGIEDVVEVAEPVIAWLSQVTLVAEGIATGTPSAASAIPITSLGLVDTARSYLIHHPSGCYDLPGVFSGKDRREAVKGCLVAMRQRGG